MCATLSLSAVFWDVREAMDTVSGWLLASPRLSASSLVSLRRREKVQVLQQPTFQVCHTNKKRHMSSVHQLCRPAADAALPPQGGVGGLGQGDGLPQSTPQVAPPLLDHLADAADPLLLQLQR